MKDKILNSIHTKLSEGFKTNFYTKSEFESQFKKNQESIREKLTSLLDIYQDLRASDNPEVVKITLQDFIIQEFNRRQGYYGPHYTKNDIKSLKASKEYQFEAYEADYLKKIQCDNNYIVTSVIDFILNKTDDLTVLQEGQSELSISYMFWTFVHEKFQKVEESIKHNIAAILIQDPELIIESFKENYSSNPYLKLFDRTEQLLSDEPLSLFDSFIVNVGTVSYELGRSGWGTFIYQIENGKKRHSFSISLKDEKPMNGTFIHIFIIRPKFLIKFCITSEYTEVNRYIIHRDCEKVSVKNDCELVISKHHGNETIILDSRKEAFALQTKFLELREGRNHNLKL
jgi:hypothetical protein